MARHPGIVIRALSWNLFHGRDAPPDPALFTRRSRLLRLTERDQTHVQVNRPLLAEFAAVLAAREWDLALLQEAPPRWLAPLGRRLGASGAIALTSRNTGSALRARLARCNPDLVASGEGGSNQLLVRPPWRITETRRLTLARLPERRRMLWTRLEGPEGRQLAVAVLHASAGDHRHTALELPRAAEQAVAWARGAPLVLGGDFNLRPAREGRVFELLRERHGLGPTTAADAIDHLLARGLEVLEPPRRLPAGARELDAGDGLRLRLSDHAPVTASFYMR